MIVGIVAVAVCALLGFKLVNSVKKEMEEGRQYLYNVISQNADHLVKNEN